ncbi:2-oxoacid:acceptor oxidoreductase subunit alpha [Thermodesulfobacteriota bacterium]
MSIDITVRIGGQAGQGMQSIGSIMSKVFTRHGYYVFTNQDVESRIRGGHSFVQVRIKNEPVNSIADNVDILIALDKSVIDQDLSDLAEDGVMIFDGENTDFRSDNPNHLSIPMEKLAIEAGKNKIMVNAVATGAAFALMEYMVEPLLDRLAEEFERKGSDIVDKNRSSAQAGFHFVRDNFQGEHPYKLPSTPYKGKKLLINGSEAMALGAICSGLKFYSGYPMSPSTPVMEFIASKAKDYNIVLEPAEDEIAAINMIIGASFAGVRAMTATSGGGFCLMAEGLGLAGMTETPIVVIIAQRAGPATGLPTRTEQADLSFVINVSHGEFPRAVFAPGNAEQAFYIMGKAFNIADKYQIPVIVLGDQHLNDSYFTVDDLDLGQIQIDRGEILNDEMIQDAENYKRYSLNGSGISPRILPGLTRAVVYADSDEHTERGHITESALIRKQMMEKRMIKIDGIRQEMGLPEIYPNGKPDVVLLGWGSTCGAMREATDHLNNDGLITQMIHFKEIFPFPSMDFLRENLIDAKVFAVECNYTGQFANLFSSETGIAVNQKILRYDGRPISSNEIVSKVRDYIH